MIFALILPRCKWNAADQKNRDFLPVSQKIRTGHLQTVTCSPWWTTCTRSKQGQC